MSLCQSIYYDLVCCDNDRKDANYSLKIKWNVRNIANYNNANGFIVQRVELLDETGMISNYNGPYFEAWKVKNGSTQYKDYDDKFEYGMGCLITEVMSNSIGKSGKIEYRCKVYWVDESSLIHNEVSKWNPCVLMASELPSTLEKECDLFSNHKVIEERFFCHDVDFKKDDIIKKHIEETYKCRLLKKDEQLYEEIEENSPSDRYRLLFKEICLKYGIKRL